MKRNQLPEVVSEGLRIWSNSKTVLGFTKFQNHELAMGGAPKAATAGDRPRMGDGTEEADR